MPSDPIEISRTIVERSSFGGHDSIVKENYIAPMDADGRVAADPHRESDRAMAQHVRAFLLTRFPVGYEWCVEADQAQGVIKISLPVLMGVCNWGVINLRTTPIDQGVLRVAGEILERYCQSRTRFQLASWLEARERHSKLVIPSRPIPT